ncbi:MAG: CaiB/BaiF CoA transferase family protein [Thermoplasmata archaeon]
MQPRRRASSLVPEFGPLAGVRVIDSARFVAGPWAAGHLAEFGAEVIHVEVPPFERPYADPTRTLVPLIPEGKPPGEQVSQSWVQYSRNKLSLAVDLRRPEGRSVFLDLIAQSDIWIESSRPGTYEKLELGDEQVRAANPRLTIVHVSGYGRTGVPERIRAPAYDLTGQAFSGFLSLQGDPDPAPPMRAGTALNDTVTGLSAAGAAIMGYAHSMRTGVGQSIDVAQYEVFFTLLENLALDYFARGVVRGRHGSAHSRLHPYDVHRAKDGWVVVAAPNHDAYLRLKEMIGFTDDRFDDTSYRLAHREPVDTAIEDFCGGRSCAELEEIARTHDVALVRVYSIADIAADPHYAARGMFVEWTDPVAGRVRGPGVAPKFEGTPGRVWRGAPWLGQDNQEILTKVLGYSEPQIRVLTEAGILGSDRPRHLESEERTTEGRE